MRNFYRFHQLDLFASLGLGQGFHLCGFVGCEHFFNNLVHGLAFERGNGFHLAGYWHFSVDFGEFFFFGHVGSFVIIFAVSFRLSPLDLAFPVGCRGYRLLPLGCGEPTPAVSVSLCFSVLLAYLSNPLDNVDYRYFRTFVKGGFLYVLFFLLTMLSFHI